MQKLILRNINITELIQKEVEMNVNFNPARYKINNPSIVRKTLTQFNKTGAILPVLLMECFVTGGRTYQAYKRDGFVEARERVTEESLAAIFWLFGATIFGKLLDVLSQKFGGIPKDMPDVGRDGLKSPFNNYIDDLAKKLKLSPEKKEALRNKLARFSIGKTATSLVLACLFIGLVVPKLNQAITRSFVKKADKEKNNKHNTIENKLAIKDSLGSFSAKDVTINAVENFKASKDNDLCLGGSGNLSFKGGADSLLRIVQNFEENAVWKLMGTDVGTVSGRTINARNNDERVEILFRDISSIYFYCFSIPHIIKFMNKVDTFKGLNTKLNPTSAMYAHNHLIESVFAKKQNEVVSLADFKKIAFGQEVDKEIITKIMTKKDNSKAAIITVNEFNAKIDEIFAGNSHKIHELKSKALKMSKRMQSQKQGVRLLTQVQIEDILRGGSITDSKFLSEVLNEMHSTSNSFTNKIRKLFGKPPIINDSKPISNPYKYIPQYTLEAERQQVVDYARAIVKDAYSPEMKEADKQIIKAEKAMAKAEKRLQKSGANISKYEEIIANAKETIKNAKQIIANGEKDCVVSAQRMLELNRRNMFRNGGYVLLATAVSAAFLSTVIPKIQYFITYLRTGKNSFPGVDEEQKKLLNK